VDLLEVLEMSNYSDDGLDYVFGKMGAIYGATFTRHWEGVDTQLVRDVWAEALGKFLTNKPSLDYALKNMNPDFPPSALAFAKLCQAGPEIRRDETMKIERQPTLHEQIATAAAKQKALEKLKELKRQYSQERNL
jgi:hypothetical protein